MLHDPSHKTTPEVASEIVLKQEEVEVLRSLAEEWAEIASLPVHKEKARLWQKLNDLEALLARDDFSASRSLLALLLAVAALRDREPGHAAGGHR